MDVIQFTSRAREQVEGLLEHYIEDENYEAYNSLLAALREAKTRIATDCMKGKAYPSQYPKMARWRYLWLREGSYWFGWSNSRGFPVITNVFYVTARMWGRVELDEGEPTDL